MVSVYSPMNIYELYGRNTYCRLSPIQKYHHFHDHAIKCCLFFYVLFLWNLVRCVWRLCIAFHSSSASSVYRSKKAKRGTSLWFCQRIGCLPPFLKGHCHQGNQFVNGQARRPWQPFSESTPCPSPPDMWRAVIKEWCLPECHPTDFVTE